MYESFIGKLLISSTCIEDPIYSRGVCLVVHSDENRTIGVMLNRPMQPSPENLMKMIGHSEVPENEMGVEIDGEEMDDESYDHDGQEYDYTEFDPTGMGEFGSLESNPSPKSDSKPVNRLGKPVPTRADEETVLRASGSLGVVHFGGPLSGPVVAVHGSSELAEAETGQGVYVAAQKQHLEDLVRHKPSPYRLIVGHLGWESEQLMAEIQSGVWHLVPATADVVFDTENDMWARLVRRATAHSLARWIGTPDVPAAQQLN